ncbi:hypothetical protein KC19_11G095600 [Ceratodon purpureus]|uniref:Uncharacterized protein n=1 Tax=Ceratodon purpureus TaxID=3225 RepID=A0A8T0GD98_CERPU|nr:hypothetical protein KC19_11G095600 [Ceratodon purpureus]
MSCSYVLALPLLNMLCGSQFEHGLNSSLPSRVDSNLPDFCTTCWLCSCFNCRQ